MNWKQILIVASLMCALAITGCTVDGTSNTSITNAKKNMETTEDTSQSGTKYADFAKYSLSPHQTSTFPNRCIRYGDQVYIDPDLEYCFAYPFGFSLMQSPIQSGKRDGFVFIQSKKSFPYMDGSQGEFFLDLKVSLISRPNTKTTLLSMIDDYMTSKGRNPSDFNKKLVDTAHNDCTKAEKMTEAYVVIGIENNFSHDIFIMRNSTSTEVLHISIGSTDTKAYFIHDMELLYTGVLESFAFLPIKNECGNN